MENNKKKGLIALGLALTMGIGGASLYFTDSESVTNKFKTGKVDITLTEPNWKQDENKEITPNKEIKKDPTITNTGVNDAFIFAEVTVPYASVITADVTTGQAEAQATEHELFTYTVNEGWTEITSAKTKDTENSTYTHVYAYTGTDTTTLEAIAKNSSKTLFNTVTFINVVEGQGLEEKNLDVKVEAKAIQTSDITDADITSPEGVLNVLNTQGAGAHKK